MESKLAQLRVLAMGAPVGFRAVVGVVLALLTEMVNEIEALKSRR